MYSVSPICRCLLFNATATTAIYTYYHTLSLHDALPIVVDRIREVVPNAKLAYNNSPSFNWTLNFRQQVFDAWEKDGKDVSAYDRAKLMSVDYEDRKSTRLNSSH